MDFSTRQRRRRSTRCALAGRAPRGRVRRGRRGRGDQPDDTAWDLRGRMGEAARARPLGRARLARGVRRAQRELRRADHLQRGVREGGTPTCGASSVRGSSPDGARAWHRGAEAPVPAEDPVRRGAVVPGTGAERPAPTCRTCRRARCSTAISAGRQRAEGAWTTLKHCAMVLRGVVRTDPDAPAHKGLSYVLVPMDQTGVSVRPLKQMTGTAEFNEVFFDDAHRQGERRRRGERRVEGLHGNAGFERGTAFLAQQIAFPARDVGADRGGAQERRHRRPVDPPGARRRASSASRS